MEGALRFHGITCDILSLYNCHLILSFCKKNSSNMIQISSTLFNVNKVFTVQETFSVVFICISLWALSWQRVTGEFSGKFTFCFSTAFNQEVINNTRIWWRMWKVKAHFPIMICKRLRMILVTKSVIILQAWNGDATKTPINLCSLLNNHDWWVTTFLHLGINWRSEELVSVGVHHTACRLSARIKTLR